VSRGGLPELLEVYGALGSSGRMVIIGPAGSGKSGAAVLLTSMIQGHSGLRIAAGDARFQAWCLVPL